MKAPSPKGFIYGVMILVLAGPVDLPADTTGRSEMSETPMKSRPRARELGIAPGVLKPGDDNAITDVPGVRVGHYTLIQDPDIRTGATAILPHGGNLFQDKVPAGVFVMNGYGKLAGSTQVVELGEIETPIVLTNTLAVATAMDAVIEWTLAQTGNEQVRSVNAVVGETNDGKLNAIRKRALTPDMVMEAITGATSDPPEEGTVGAGTGTVALGWKGGIGTSSRRVLVGTSTYTVGVLVQSNFGGQLVMNGHPVGRALKSRATTGRPATPDQAATEEPPAEYGSIMIVLATDAPLSDRNLERMARRTMAGLARTGASFSNGSGDYAIAFSTAESVRRHSVRIDTAGGGESREIGNDRMSRLFRGAADATEEAVYNSLLKATSVDSHDPITDLPVSVPAIPIDEVARLLEQGRSEL